MNREVHVRFWERAGVKLPRATRQHRLFCHITQLGFIELRGIGECVCCAIP
jgi:hypothetical protein